MWRFIRVIANRIGDVRFQNLPDRSVIEVVGIESLVSLFAFKGSEVAASLVRRIRWVRTARVRLVRTGWVGGLVLKLNKSYIVKNWLTFR